LGRYTGADGAGFFLNWGFSWTYVAMYMCGAAAASVAMRRRPCQTLGSILGLSHQRRGTRLVDDKRQRKGIQSDPARTVPWCSTLSEIGHPSCLSRSLGIALGALRAFCIILSTPLDRATPHLPKSPSQAPVTTEKKYSAHCCDHRFVTTHHTPRPQPRPRPQLPQPGFHSLHTRTHVPANTRPTHHSTMAVRASFENSNEYVRPRAAHGDPSPPSIRSFIACSRTCRCPCPK